MDLFVDRTHVWLRSRDHDDDYLLASEDGEVVGFSEDAGGVLHGAWAVHRLERGGTDYVLFHSASYGRYLALVDVEPDVVVEDDEVDYYGPGQCTYDSPEQVNVLFQARRSEDGSQSDDDIFLSNPRVGDWWHDHMMPIHWAVEAIPARLFPPELPDPPEPIPTQLVEMLPGCRRRQLEPPEVVLRRRINYVRAGDQGNFNPQQWRVLEQFEGQSVFNLRRDLAAALGEADNNDLGITLCVWGGSNGRLTPLVIDLPSDEKTMHIVVLTTGSPAALALRHPNVDAQ